MRRPAHSRAARRARCSWAAARLRAPALRAAARIAAATGCALIHETFAARIERGAGLPAAERLPYFPEQGAERLRPLAHLVLAGAREPVAFFGYPGSPEPARARAPRACQVLADDAEDVAGALEALALRVKAPARVASATPERVGLPSGPLTAGALGQALAALQPEGAIVVDEGCDERARLLRAVRAERLPTTISRSRAARSGRGSRPPSAPRSRVPTAR